MAKQSDEISSLRVTMTTLDREKDALQINLDERVELISDVEEQLSKKEVELKDLKELMNETQVSCLKSWDGCWRFVDAG